MEIQYCMRNMQESIEYEDQSLNVTLNMHMPSEKTQNITLSASMTYLLKWNSTPSVPIN